MLHEVVAFRQTLLIMGVKPALLGVKWIKSLSRLVNLSGVYHEQREKSATNTTGRQSVLESVVEYR